MILRKLLAFVIGALLFGCSSPASESPLPITTPTIVATSTLLAQTSTPTKVIGMVPEEYKSYIDMKFPPLPDDLKEGFGTLIFPSKNVDWSITVVTGENDTMLWFSKMVQNGNPPIWQVSDILLLPDLTNTEVLVPNGCRIHELDDPEIIVVADISPTASSLRYVDSSSISSAWRANRLTGVFQEVEIDTSLECYLDNAIELKK